MIKEAFMFGWRNMTHRKLRSWLTILGVIIGIAAIVSLMTIGNGLENAIVEQFAVLGSDKIRVVPEGITGPPVGVTGLTEDDIKTIEDTIGVDYAGGLLFSTSVIEYNKQELVVFVKGLDAELAEQNKIDVNVEIKEGSWFEKGESNVAVIGHSLAEGAYEKDIRVKNKIYLDGREIKVIGILEPIGEQGIDKIIYIPLEDAREFYNNEEGVNALFATVEEGKDINEVAEKIEKDLERDRKDDNFLVFTAEEILSQLGSILTVVQFILGGIAAISLFVGGIGIMNSMYTSVTERTKQIGLMKAVGANRMQILFIFLLESGMIGLVGGILGIILGTVLAFLVQGVATLAGFNLLKITVVWDVVLFSLLFSFVVGLISGFLPAYRAARYNAVDALRYE
jgi:putative ABC transport system permease protein